MIFYYLKSWSIYISCLFNWLKCGQDFWRVCLLAEVYSVLFFCCCCKAVLSIFMSQNRAEMLKLPLSWNYFLTSFPLIINNTYDKFSGLLLWYNTMLTEVGYHHVRGNFCLMFRIHTPPPCNTCLLLRMYVNLYDYLYVNLYAYLYVNLYDYLYAYL